MSSKTKTRWKRSTEFVDEVLVRQKNGTWRMTTSTMCGGPNCGPEPGQAHYHEVTRTIATQDAVNQLVDWGHEGDLAETDGLGDYVG